VAVVEAGKGIRRTAVIDAAGQYRITGLSPATYEFYAGAGSAVSNSKTNPRGIARPTRTFLGECCFHRM
jgi:protocatechuate 3,4-dioxygenase beta subunit